MSTPSLPEVIAQLEEIHKASEHNAELSNKIGSVIIDLKQLNAHSKKDQIIAWTKENSTLINLAFKILYEFFHSQ